MYAEVCVLDLVQAEFSRDARDGVSSKGVNEGEMLLLLYRGYTRLSAPLWLTTQNVFSTKCVSVCVYVRERGRERVCVCVKNDYSPGTFSLNALLCIFFKIVLEKYR